MRTLAPRIAAFFFFHGFWRLRHDDLVLVAGVGSRGYLGMRNTVLLVSDIDRAHVVPVGKVHVGLGLYTLVLHVRLLRPPVRLLLGSQCLSNSLLVHDDRILRMQNNGMI